MTRLLFYFVAVYALVPILLVAQDPPYVDQLPVDPPYYRVRYAGDTEAGQLIYPVSFRLWLPPGVQTVRGIVVHQHGCGEGSCKSGQTGAFDLHWQALAKKHDCALLSPVYEQPEKADCQAWCDPRRGSAAAFQQGLTDLAKLTQHSELATVPWALWGHSGGGHWAGGMTLLHPERVVAAWLRSGVPPLVATEGRPVPWEIPTAATTVPVMCNLGTKEGVTVRDGRFAKVWEGVERFFLALRAQGGLAAVAVDPLSSHECGNQRYLAIMWFDAMLTARLPAKHGQPLRPMPADSAWLVVVDATHPTAVAPVPAAKFMGDAKQAAWLPNETIAKAWSSYSQDTSIADLTPPPAPTNLRVEGNEIRWDAEADLESGLARFHIERDGKMIATVPEQAKNPFGRPLFQNNSYSDTPTQPLVVMRYVDLTAEAGKSYQYRVITENTVGLKSP